jgi:SagB-type dehydrogenase family enzyme
MMPEQVISLPTPRLSGAVSVEEAISTRRSIRSFDRRKLSWEQIGQLAWAAQGITGDDRRWRVAPSAGALHPLELYVLFSDSSYHYDPVTHSLRFHQTADLSEVADAALKQPFIAQAACVFAFSGRVTRTAKVYGERALRYVCMDLGHAAQNLLLQAAALGLAGTPVGAFDDAALRFALKLSPGDEPLYLVPVGYPK